MKKTMIALAAVAAAGAASAQVTLSGEFAWGYGNYSTAGSDTSGGGIDTSQVVFAANEDLGGGMSIAAKMAVNLGEYGGTTGADDQSLTLTTPFGALSLLTYKPGNWVSGASGAGTWYGLDGRSLAARAKRDGYAFAIPVMTGLTATLAFTEPAGSTGEGAGNAGQSGQGIYNVSAKYTSGPAVVQGAYLVLTNGGATDATKESVYRLGGTYDLGVAKVGVAYEGTKLSGGGSNVETAYSLTAPLASNLSVAATYASTNLSSSLAAISGAAGIRNGYQLQAQYNLSKTAYVIGSYGSWTGTTTTNSVTTTNTKDSSLTALTLVKDF